MAEIQWWYARNEQQDGPVSPAELRRLAASGSLAPTDLVWREGMEEWAPAIRLKGLFPESRDALAEATPAKDAVESVVPFAFPTDLAAPQPLLETPPLMAGRSFPTESDRAPLAVSIPRVLSGGGGDKSRLSRPGLKRILFFVQGMLWGLCVLVILFGGLLFTLSKWRDKPLADQASSAIVLSAFVIGAYALARAGEKLARLVLAYMEDRS